MKRLLVIGLVFGLPAAASAEGFSYDYIDAGYIQSDISGIDGDGFGIAGSMSLNNNWHLFAGYQTQDFDFGVDLDALQAGAGFNTSMSENLDVFARVSYIWAEAEAGGFAVDDDGFGVGVGVRGAVSESVELNGGVEYTDGDASDGDTAFNAGFLFNVTEQVALGLNASFGDDIDMYTAGVRWNF